MAKSSRALKKKTKIKSKAKAIPAGKRKSSKKSAPKTVVLKCPRCLGWIPTKLKSLHLCDIPTEQSVLVEANPDEDVLAAWRKLRGFLESLGPQRIYASRKAIMFARKTCYLFVRPKKNKLEVCFFLNKSIRHPSVHSVTPGSSVRRAITVWIVHEDQIESPMTDWIADAWSLVQPERDKI